MHGIILPKEIFWKVASGETTYLCYPIKNIPKNYRLSGKNATRIMFSRGSHKIKRNYILKAGEIVYLRESITYYRPAQEGSKYRPAMESRLLYQNNYKEATAERFKPWVMPDKMKIQYARVLLVVISTKIKHIAQLSVADAYCLGYADPRKFIKDWNLKHPTQSFKDDPWVFIARVKVTQLNHISDSRIRLMKQYYNEINDSK